MALDLESVPRMVLDTNIFFSYSVASVWNSLRSVNGTIERLQSQLLVVQNDFSRFNSELISAHPYSADLIQWMEASWADYYQRLRRRAAQLYIDRRQVELAETVAVNDMEQACALLSRAVHKAFTSGIARLQSYLRMARSLRSVLLRFAAKRHNLHNKITLQRRFYLTHGAHPNDVASQLGRPVRLRGCVPAFEFLAA